MQELLLTYEYEIIHFEYSHAAVYLELQHHKTKTIISIHDIISHSFLRKSVTNPLLGIEVARIFRYESKLYSAASKLWLLSEKYRNILTSLFTIPGDKIIVKPPRVSHFINNFHRTPEKIESKTLLFWAAMNRPENERGIIIFIDKCFQKILVKHPDFKLYIVGYKPSEKNFKLAANKNIIVTGFVEDPTQFFEKAEIGIVPLLEGSGIKLKTLEMLHVNMPVISTSIGAEGIDITNQYLLINDNFDEWVDLIRNITLSKC
ncbi:glycosyltransferase family 4 protein [Mastigocoleus sp. MO_188.B34]|uniref:glycosyltransferase family 4 protein n=1 Tax=Mastigocoleus sp. MO_188.B34 TaxID=3036635 RepID=UPI00261BED84|nr:glycosyltransferase family 4 protein [Mastigocoleus sp. MO_188.B34]MDJ0693194.1 glycosyltransferase family 4 protein [Mastigocoleus sp. MO_188.B34]